MVCQVVELLKKRNLKIAFAESCTGGLAAAEIVSVPGSSDVLDMSVVTYANSAKTEYTDVTDSVLERYGAVSEQTASLMACGIRKRANAGVGVGITGIAGPGGGTEEKPVGTVYAAVDFEGDVTVRALNLSGDRQRIRRETVREVMEMLLGLLKNNP